MFQDTLVRRIVGLVGAAAVIALLAYTYATLMESRYTGIGPTTINVTGKGEVFAVPDIATFSFSVTAKEADAGAAKTRAAESMNAMLAYLKEKGIEDRDVKTEYYNLSPRYEYPREICPVGSYCPPGEPKLVGYEVSQSIAVKVRNTDDAGMLLSGVAELGATNVSGLNFTIDDEEALKAKAREAAIKDAQAKAEKLADELNVRIVRMTGYWENEAPMPYYAYGMGGGEKAMDAVAAAPMPDIPVGENTITSQVNVTYQVR